MVSMRRGSPAVKRVCAGMDCAAQWLGKDGKKVVEPAEETTDALRRLTQWSTYQMVKLYMRKEQHDELLPKIAEEIGIEHKLLQAV